MPANRSDPPPNETVAALLAEALELLQTAERPTRGLTEVWRVQRETGDADGANETLARAWQSAEPPPPAVQRTGELHFVAEAQERAGDLDGMRRTTDRVANAGVKVALLCRLAVLLYAGDADAARRTFADAVRIAQAIPDAGEAAGALLPLAQAQTAMGDDAGMRRTLEEANRAVAALEDDRDRAIYLHRVCEVWLLARDAEQVRRIVDGIAAGDTVAGAANQVMALYRIARSQTGVGDKAMAFAVTFPENTRDLAGAPRTLALARRIALTMADGNEKDSGLRSVAVFQARAGDTKGAIETAGDIKSAFYRDNALGGIAAKTSKPGVLERPVWSVEAAESLARAGDYAGARSVVDAITDEGEKAVALVRFARAMADAEREAAATV